MKTIKFIWKFVLRLIALCCLLLSSYLIMGEVLGRQLVNADFVPDPNGIEIFILSNGVHTDIAVPTITAQKDWSQFLDPADFQPPLSTPPEYIAFGWGDRSLYEDVPQWADLTFPILVNAMLLPSQSAMHITYFAQKPAASDTAIPVKISPEQYDILIDEFVSSFTLNEEGAPESLNCCFYPRISDQFYQANRPYHIMNTCNMWTNRLLKSAGLPTARWAPQESYIMRHLNQQNLSGK